MAKNLALLLLAIVGVSCATQKGGERGGIQLGTTTSKAAPAAWQKVQVVEVSAAPGDVSAFAVDPNQALGKALLARLGSDASRSATLQVSNVRASVNGDGMSLRLGLGADFTLRTAAGEKTLRLEHSLNLMQGADGGEVGGYARLIDDLCDRLFYHPEALAFLAQEGQAPFEDSALQSGAKDLGPVMGTAATSPGVEASGRILWGPQEVANSGAVTVLLGDTKMFTGYYMNRSTNVASGFGMRSGLGIAVMPPAKSATSVPGYTPPTFFGLMLQVGLELGLIGVNRSPEGYVLSPGFSAVLVPQATGFLLTGSASGISMTMRMVTVGAALEADLPIGSSFGVTASVFVGATGTSMTFSSSSYGSSSSSTGFSRVMNPAFDIYTQSSTGRVSLGLGLQSLAQAASSGESASTLAKNPMLMFTWQDWVGRGMAYSKQELAIAGLTVNDSAEVLSSPKSAFVDDQGNSMSANAGGPVPPTFYPSGGPVSLFPTSTTPVAPAPTPPPPAPVVAPPPPTPMAPSEPAPKPATGQEPERRKLGIRFRDVTPEYAREVGLEAATGVEITAVTPGSPAAEAELVPGDVILAVDGVAVANGEALKQALARTESVASFELKIWHDGGRWIRGVFLGAVTGPTPTPEERVKAKAGAAMDALDEAEQKPPPSR